MRSQTTHTPSPSQLARLFRSSPRALVASVNIKRVSGSPNLGLLDSTKHVLFGWNHGWLPYPAEWDEAVNHPPPTSSLLHPSRPRQCRIRQHSAEILSSPVILDMRTLQLSNNLTLRDV